jgi:hypothetical protein
VCLPLFYVRTDESQHARIILYANGGIKHACEGQRGRACACVCPPYLEGYCARLTPNRARCWSDLAQCDAKSSTVRSVPIRSQHNNNNNSNSGSSIQQGQHTRSLRTTFEEEAQIKNTPTSQLKFTVIESLSDGSNWDFVWARLPRALRRISHVLLRGPSATCSQKNLPCATAGPVSNSGAAGWGD